MGIHAISTEIDAIRRVLSQVVDLVASMERGQAHTPIRDNVADIEKSLAAEAGAIAVVNLDESSRQAVDGLNRGPFLSVALNELWTRPVVLSRLLARAHFLIVIGPRLHRLSPHEADVISELAHGVRAIQPVLHDAENSQPEPDWLKTLAPTALPALFAYPMVSSAELAQVLTSAHQALRLETTLGLIADRVNDDLRRQEARRKILLRRNADLGGRQAEQAARAVGDVIRQAVQDKLNRLETTLSERLRARVLPDSPCLNRINNRIEDLAVSDMTEETHGRMVQISLKPDTLHSAVRLLEERVRQDVEADLHDAQQGVKELEEAAQLRLLEVN